MTDRPGNKKPERIEDLQSLFENRHTPMLLIDPVDQKIVDANPAACIFSDLTKKGYFALKQSQV